MQTVIVLVDKKWQWIIDNTKNQIPAGTVVKVKFKIEAKAGEVSEILDVDSIGSKNAQDMCVSAIVSNSPYGVWTPEMIAVLGQSQEITFAFYYQ